MSTNAQRVQLGPFFSGGTLQGGCKLYHYQAGTSTDKPIWDDQKKVTALPQPLMADQDGMFNFFADGLYKIIICRPQSTDPSSEILYTLDNFSWLDPTDTDLAQGDTLPSASTMPVGPNIRAHILGSTTITALAEVGTVPWFWAVFDGSPLLVHSSHLLLPGSRNRKMLTGDVALFFNEGDGIWRMAAHMEAEGNFIGRKGANIAVSSTLTPPPDGDLIDLTGNDTDITAIASAAAGYRFTVRFIGSGNQFIHNATSLICPYGTDYRTMTNELVELRSLGNGNWIMAFRTGSTDSPGTPKGIFSTTADDGYVLPVGTAINCTRYAALAKRCIPAASVLGTTGTSLGNPTFDNTTEIWTLNAHGLLADDIVHLTNSGGTLPTGYAINTVYFVVNRTTNTFQLSLTRGGSAVNGTTNGTGTQTVHNKFQLPDVRGMALAALDNLGGSSANRVTSASTNGANASVLGGKFGAQTHTLSQSEMPAHTHARPNDNGGSGGAGRRWIFIDGDMIGSTTNNNSNTDSTGGGAAHSNTPPTMAVGVQLRW